MGTNQTGGHLSTLRRALLLFVLAVLLLSASEGRAPVSAANVMPSGSAATGDVDCSGDTDPIDALQLLLSIAELPANDDCLEGAEVSCAGGAEAPNILNVLRIVIGEPQPLDCGGGTEPSSSQLIDDAEASAAIDAQTATVYRVYAAFDDARLPAQYQGDDSDLIDSADLTEAAGMYDDLSPANQALVGPYLMPPNYVGSWWWQQQQPQAAPAAVEPPCVPRSPAPDLQCPLSDDWVYKDASVANVRVWWQSQYPQDEFFLADPIIGYLDNDIWPKLTQLMGRVPLLDTSEPNNGGDGRIDIALIDFPAYAYAIGYHGCSTPTPGYMLVGRADNPFGLGFTLAHEFMHLIQYAFDPANPCADYEWWQEASAHWAGHYVYPEDNTEHQSVDKYLYNIDAPLERNGPPGKYYGEYILPLFLSFEVGADVMRTIAEAGEQTGPRSAINQSVPGGLADIWPKFALATWNHGPIDDYQVWDDLEFADDAPLIEDFNDEVADICLTPAGASVSSAECQAGTEGYHDLQMFGPNPFVGMTMKYFHVRFPDDSVSHVTLFNSLTYDPFPQTVEGLGEYWGYGAADPADYAGARIWLLAKVNGQWQEPVDWTSFLDQTWCRDVAGEHIEELVVIYSNSNFANPQEISDDGSPTFLRYSNAGCWRWEGTIDLMYHYTDGQDITETLHADVVFQRSREIGGLGSVITENYNLVEGTIEWDMSGAVGDCTVSGSDTVPIEQVSSFLIGLNVLEGPFYRASTGTINSESDVTVSQHCPDSDDSYGKLVGTSTSCVANDYQLLSDDGRVINPPPCTIDGFTGGDSELRVHLEAVRE